MYKKFGSDLQGKVALITGASKGLGLGLAKICAQEGAKGGRSNHETFPAWRALLKRSEKKAEYVKSFPLTSGMCLLSEPA